MVLLENLQTQENREMDMANKLVVNIKKISARWMGVGWRKKKKVSVAFHLFFYFYGFVASLAIL